MTWQDAVFAIGSFVLSLALAPALVGHINAPVWSAALTSATLGAFAATYFTMRYHLASAMVAVQFILWIIILVRGV